jgi:hypothetical protein
MLQLAPRLRAELAEAAETFLDGVIIELVFHRRATLPAGGLNGKRR